MYGRPLLVKYCEEHGANITDSYDDVTILWEGSISTIETFYFPEDRKKRDEFLDKQEAEIREQLDAMTPEALANHLANGGATIKSSYHEHEFDSREECEEWTDKGPECFCESYELRFNSVTEYEPKLQAL
jgi:hypothetical protein